MSEIKFACPYCGQHIACDAGYGDLAIDCPACGNALVVPRLTAAASGHRSMVVVASTPSPKHAPPPIQPVRAWTEQEWSQLSREMKGRADGQAPHWVLSAIGTLIVAFILRVNLASPWLIAGALVCGSAISAVLLSKGRKSAGAYVMLQGLGYFFLLLALLPVVALGVLFVGCMACR